MALELELIQLLQSVPPSGETAHQTATITSATTPGVAPWMAAFRPAAPVGFEHEVLHVYPRGPNDAPGNQMVYLCQICDQGSTKGHAPDCPRSASGETGDPKP